jgi:hypothetical protein
LSCFAYLVVACRKQTQPPIDAVNADQEIHRSGRGGTQG